MVPTTSDARSTQDVLFMSHTALPMDNVGFGVNRYLNDPDTVNVSLLGDKIRFSTGPSTPYKNLENVS